MEIPAYNTFTLSRNAIVKVLPLLRISQPFYYLNKPWANSEHIVYILALIDVWGTVNLQENFFSLQVIPVFYSKSQSKAD